MKEKIGKIIEQIETKKDPEKAYKTMFDVCEVFDELSEMDAVKSFKAISEYFSKIASYIKRLEEKNKKLAEQNVRLVKE